MQMPVNSTATAVSAREVAVALEDEGGSVGVVKAGGVVGIDDVLTGVGAQNVSAS